MKSHTTNLGIGIDIVDIQRFRKISYSSNPGFYKKIFIPSEIKYCRKFKDPYPHFAGKFAVKESVIKAINEPVHMLKIETIHVNSKPAVKLRGKLENRYRFLTSLSHDKNIAIAVVISEVLS